MKKLFSSLKKGASFIVIAALLLTLCSCSGESGSDNSGSEKAKPEETVAYTVKNDKIGMQVSFHLPGTAEDWEQKDRDFQATGLSYGFYPTDKNLDGTNSWYVDVDLTVSTFKYKSILIDGKEPTEDNESVVESDSGKKWVKIDNNSYYTYGTIFDDYIDGYHVAEIRIKPNGSLEDGQKPDMERLAQIEKTVLNSFTYDSDYEGKPDYSDAAYTGSLIVKWPFEIPFEDGVIKAERYINSTEVFVKFEYENPAESDTSYRVELRGNRIYKPASYNNMTYLDRQYFGEDASHKDEPYEEIEISGYKAAMRFGSDSYVDFLIVECAKDGANEYPVLEMYTFIDSDEEDRYNDKNKQKIIAMVTAIINSAEFLELETDA